MRFVASVRRVLKPQKKEPGLPRAPGESSRSGKRLLVAALARGVATGKRAALFVLFGQRVLVARAREVLHFVRAETEVDLRAARVEERRNRVERKHTVCLRLVDDGTHGEVVVSHE